MSETLVKYRLFDKKGHTVVTGQLFIYNGDIVHNIMYHTFLCWRSSLVVSMKLGRIEENYKNLMDYGLKVLAACI